MLKHLFIQNYALINALDIDFDKGFTVITGETGAGKSILLGALSLILGQRADSSVLKEKSKKCIVEGKFDVKNYSVQNLFQKHELDFEETAIIRREVGAEGKSRAFINDTPVNLNVLKEITSKLIDIHSQHQSLLLADLQYQLSVIDAYAKNENLLLEYKMVFSGYREAKHNLSALIEKATRSKSDLDYFQFQFSQLDEAKLDTDEESELEKEQQALTHAEEIKTALQKINYLLEEKDENALIILKEIQTILTGIQKYLAPADTLIQRISSIIIELKDIISETDILSSEIEYNPERIAWINERLDLIYTLQQKHRVSSLGELISIREELQKKIHEIESFDVEITAKEKATETLRLKLSEIADKLTASRKKVIPAFESDIKSMLVQLGMPHASFFVNLNKTEDFLPRGMDNVLFLFSANKNIEPQEISKVASGGELSRLMLSIKSKTAGQNQLPTIIFDEIDTGVSGEIADKMGSILKKMSKEIQIIGITHLPQIASKGKDHCIVYKKEGKETTSTHIRILTQEERVKEIAKMLSGSQLTEAALSNALELLN